MDTKSSFYSDTPNYATNYPTQNDSNTEPVNGNSVSPSSFYPDGGTYQEADPDAAAASASQAAASASAAAASASSAASHDTSAAAHDASSATHDTNAAASDTAAANSATAAAASASSAASHDSSAGTHDTNAAASASAAATNATNAGNSATAAAGSASSASTSATNAANSASAAAASAASLVGPMVFKGTWDASTNTPALASGAGTKGWLYKVSVAGSTSIDGISQWNVGDTIVFDGTTWDKIDGIASEVISVAGRTGAVTLTAADVSGALTDAPSDGNEYARKNGAWALAAGAVTMQDTAPTGLTSGSLWWNTTNGQLYVLFGTAWVAASTIATLPGAVQYDVAQALSAAQQAQARKNISVARGLFLVDMNNVNPSGTTAAYNKLSFTNKQVDPEGCFSTTTGRYTAPVAGTYCFTLNIGLTALVSGDGPQGCFYVNGAVARKGPYGNNITTQEVTAYLVLNANDYVEPYSWLPSGATFNGQVVATNFQGYRISD